MTIANVVIGTKVLGSKGNEIIDEVNDIRADLTAVTALEAAHAPTMRLGGVNHSDKLHVVGNLVATTTQLFGTPGSTEFIAFGTTFAAAPTVVAMGANGADVTLVLNAVTTTHFQLIARSATTGAPLPFSTAFAITYIAIGRRP